MTDTTTGDRPRLGDFTRPSKKKPGDDIPEEEKVPVTPRPAAKKSAPEPTPDQMPPETEEEKEAQARMDLYQEMQTAMLPIENYKEYLEKQGIDEEQAARIVDDLMLKGHYEEDYKLSRSVTVTLRTRQQRDVRRLTMAVQVQRPLFQDAMDELISRYNMASSLAAYNGKEYEFPADDDSQERVDELFDARLTAVETMPAPVFSAISMKLAKFDRMVLAVMREGVAENF